MQLYEYLPFFVSNTKEFKELYKVLQPEADNLFTETDNRLKDMFVLGSSEEGTKHYEKIVSITPKLTDSLEKRQLDILAIYNEVPPFTYERLEEILTSTLGANNFKIKLDLENYFLEILLKRDKAPFESQINAMLERIVPVNIVLRYSIDWNKWKDLKPFKWSTMSTATWKEARESEEFNSMDEIQYITKEIFDEKLEQKLDTQVYNSDKSTFQLESDENLDTNNKTIVGAINELNTKIGDENGNIVSNDLLEVHYQPNNKYIKIGSTDNSKDNKNFTAIAIGKNALKSINKEHSSTKIDNVDNIAIGGGTLENLSIGDQNIYASYANIAIGSNTLNKLNSNNTNGYEAYANIAIGSNSLSELSTGGHNISIGVNSLSKVTGDDSNNISIGYNSASYASNYSDCVMIGNTNDVFAKGEYDNNVVIGNSAMYSSSSFSDSVIIGTNSTKYVKGNNFFVIGSNVYNNYATDGVDITNTGTLGNDKITHIKANVTAFTALSDKRTKRDIVPADLDICLENVKKIPLSYYAYKKECSNQYDEHKLGWLAQDVQIVFPKSVQAISRAFNKLDEKGNPIIIKKKIRTLNEQGIEVDQEQEVVDQYIIDDCLELTPDQMLPTLWGAVQNLINKIENLEEEIKVLKNKQK